MAVESFSLAKFAWVYLVLRPAVVVFRDCGGGVQACSFLH